MKIIIDDGSYDYFCGSCNSKVTDGENDWNHCPYCGDDIHYDADH